MKSLVFWLKCHWSLFPGVQLKIPSVDKDNGLLPYRRQAIIWTNGDRMHWRIYAALGADELSHLNRLQYMSLSVLGTKRGCILTRSHGIQNVFRATGHWSPFPSTRPSQCERKWFGIYCIASVTTCWTNGRVAGDLKCYDASISASLQWWCPVYS